MAEPGTKRRTHRPTPTIVLKRLRRAAGECPACQAAMTTLTNNNDGEVAGYACGAFWTWFGKPGGAKAGRCNVSCGKGKAAE